MVPSDEIFTIKELSEYLRVHRTTIYRLLRRGLLIGFRVGNSWRFNRAVIDQLEIPESATLQRSVPHGRYRAPRSAADHPEEGLHAVRFCQLCGTPSDWELVRVHTIEIASHSRELWICRKCTDAIRRIAQ